MRVGATGSPGITTVYAVQTTAEAEGGRRGREDNGPTKDMDLKMED